MTGWGNFKYDHNAVIIILDSLRQDVFAQAKIPNITNLGGKIYKECYSQSSQTLAAYFLMMIGHFPYEDKTEQIFGRMLWLPFEAKKKRMRTWGIVSLPYLSPDYNCDAGWDEWIMMRRIDMADTIIDRSIEMIKDADRNYLLFLNFGETHRPYNFGSSKTNWLKEDVYNFNYEGGVLEPEYLCYLKKRQGLALEFLDEKLAELFEALDLDQTTVMITSDHGELFGENHLQGHGIGHHSALFHVPMIIKEPDSFEAMDKEQTEEVKKRLRSLGYL